MKEFSNLIYTVAIALGLLCAVNCAPTSPNREPYNPLHNDVFNQPHNYDWNNNVPIHGDYHHQQQGDYSNTFPQTGYPSLNEFAGLSDFPLSPGTTQEYGGHHGYLSNQGSTPHWMGDIPQSSTHQESYYDPSDFSNMHLSTDHYGISDSHNPNAYPSYPQYSEHHQSVSIQDQHEHLPAYSSPRQYNSPSPSNTPSPTRVQEGPQLNNRYKVSEAELESRSDKLNDYEWQKYYYDHELVDLYRTLFIWGYLPKSTARRVFERINTSLENEPELIPQIEQGKEDVIHRIAYEAGPSSMQHWTFAGYNPKSHFDKEAFIEWILKQDKKKKDHLPIWNRHRS